MAIVYQGVGVGPGSAARSTSSTKGKASIKIGRFSGGQYKYSHEIVTPLLLSRELVFRGPNLLDSKRSLPGFSGSATILYCQTFH